MFNFFIGMFCLDAVCNYANERGISVKHSVLRAASLLLFIDLIDENLLIEKEGT